MLIYKRRMGKSTGMQSTGMLLEGGGRLRSTPTTLQAKIALEGNDFGLKFA